MDTQTVTLLKTLAPNVAAMTEDAMNAAWAAAEGFMPLKLPPKTQNEARLWYTAHLLTMKQAADNGTLPPVGIKSESEGDLSRSYGSLAEEGDPFGYYARWKALMALEARLGGITVGSRLHEC